MAEVTEAGGTANRVWVSSRVGSVSFALLLAVALLGGFGGCASRAPVTPSAATTANSGAPQGAPGLHNCPIGRADCDGKPANRCEAVLADDLQNCGACGVRCA